ncbi:N-acetylmuramoyl-L-alanine amidase family protein [Clostridium brassicae]|uniref:N-acetylmuramoyl-L-alanine amidase n=1 Tax=Clostridium brassicae TaxID=2999072 RepID=A0ABT4DEF9_9CLOT|nr:N-acetylmuramoyl-L-alanine amidase [Clostridium brassicae]MCY6960687.1 N-acetylmuramoyl-L-alanine amidase [Clostridium brassicae]
MKKLKGISIIIAMTALFSACGSKESASNDEQDKKVSIENSTLLQEKNSQQIEKNISKSDENSSKDSSIKNNLQDNKKNKQNLNENSSLKKENKNNTSSQDKLKNKIIVIDPGHASKADTSKEPEAPNSSKLKYKQTGGAQGVTTKTPEYEINMKVAQKLKNRLELKGYNVIMTKTDNDKTMSNIARAKVGNNSNAALVLRIHADSAESSLVKGASILVPAKNDYTKGFYNESKNFGKVILDSLINEVGMKNRGVVERGDITGFNWSTVPVVLVEMGFLSNPQEDRLLSSSDYQEKISEGITKGIEKIYNTK